MFSRLTNQRSLIAVGNYKKNNVRALSTAMINLTSASKNTNITSEEPSQSIIATEINNAGILTLNRPKALNALNIDMVRDLYSSLVEWETTKSLVIVKSGMEKSFCAGGDVRALTEEPPKHGESFFREEYTLNHLIGSYRIPYVALISGITMGGGVGISVHGKYRVASERTMFAMPETAIGLFPDVGGSHFLPRLTGQLGMYLGLTGVRLKGHDVQRAGIATHYCESNRLPELETALTTCKNDDEVSNVLKKFCAPTDDGGVKNDKFCFAKDMTKINECFDSDTVEGIIKKLELDNSEWAQKTLKTLEPMSPLSLKVSHHELRLGKKLNLSECLKMEFRMAVRHLENSDFKEGVRALLVDRDNKPNWIYPTIGEVRKDHLYFFFDKLEDVEELKLRDSPVSSKL